MAKKWSPMDPNDIRDYWFDWGSDELGATDRFLSDTVDIASSTVTVPTGITKVADAIEPDNKRVRVRLSNPVSTGVYDITNLITVSTGEQFEDTKTLTVKERTS